MTSIAYSPKKRKPFVPLPEHLSRHRAAPFVGWQIDRNLSVVLVREGGRANG